MGKKKKTGLVITVVLGVLFLCGPVLAVEVIEAGYVVEIFSSFSRPGIAVTRIMTFAGDGNLYVVQKADGSIWRVTPDGTASEFVSGLNLPAGITWAGGTSYGDYLYVGADRRIVRIGLDGTTSTFSSLRGISGVAVDRTGNYDGFLYATTAGTDRIYRVSGSGSASTFSSFLGSGSGGGPVGIAFDSVEDYSGLMYIPATWNTTPSKSGFFSVDPNGTTTRFTNDLAKSWRVALDETGDFGWHLFVLAADEFDGAAALWRVRPDGTAEQFTEGHVSCLAFGPDGSMYVSEYDADNETVVISRISIRPLDVAIDIKPRSCPNPLSVQSKGVLPVAILGSQDFDVNTIDMASIKLAKAAAIRSSYEDVATFVMDGIECECNTEGPDGYPDLTLKFKTQEIVEKLINDPGELENGQRLLLTLTGKLSDNTPIEGTDCVILVGNVPKALAARGSDINGDGVVNILDFALMTEYWLEATVY
ncbi:MAG: hypothetical protein ACYS9Y_07545 [Planctomycetota bacterium]|jgi:hypothetical protein